MQLPAYVYHLSDQIDGHDRPYRIVRHIRIVEQCKTLKDCYIAEDDLHISEVYEAREEIPEPKFTEYFYRYEEG